MGAVLVFSNAAEGRDAEFNTWYDEVHLGEVLELAPFVAAQRYEVVDAQMMPDQPHRYLAVYEFEGPADEAVAAMIEGGSSFERSDALADTHVVFVDTKGERQTTGRSGSTSSAMVVFATPEEGRDEQYDAWYDATHLPEVLGIGPFHAAQRYEVAESQIFPDQEYRYVAVYESDGQAPAAIEAMMASAGKLDRTEASAANRIVMVEPIGPRVEG